MERGPGLVVDRIVFPLARFENVIGRTDRAAGIFPDIDISPIGGGNAVSRRHAQISRREGRYYVSDLGSRSGTFVNGEPLPASSERELQEGDAVTIAAATLTYSSECEWPGGLMAEWEEQPSDLSTATRLPAGLSLATQLPHALRDGQLSLHYQPQVELPSGVVSSAEALIRWNHPDEGVITTDKYVDLAEESGFIRILTNFALEEAAETVQRWRAADLNTTVGVNLSVKDLEDPACADKFSSVIGSRGVSPSDFTLEVTESAVMYNPGAAIATLDHLRSLGFRIAIDDFGAGHSSLTYLKDLPADEVKLDRSFCMDMNERDQEIVRSAIEIAHILGMETVAEGIEEEEVVLFLCEAGCDKGQGYYFGRPVPETELDLELRAIPVA